MTALDRVKREMERGPRTEAVAVLTTAWMREGYSRRQAASIARDMVRMEVEFAVSLNLGRVIEMVKKDLS